MVIRSIRTATDHLAMLLSREVGSGEAVITSALARRSCAPPLSSPKGGPNDEIAEGPKRQMDEPLRLVR
jgi:hypothetical protein